MELNEDIIKNKENKENEENEENEENLKKYKMSLLYIQTKELKMLYEKPMKKDQKYYFLVNKNWLDKYKSENNYNYITGKFNDYENWSDYDDFNKKSLILYNIKENKIKKEDNSKIHKKFQKEINTKKEELDEYNLNYCINGELIKDEFFKKNISSSRDFSQLVILIGNKTILSLDQENDNYIYSYSLIQQLDDINNFYIEINNVIM